MTKRSCPFDINCAPQLKIHISEKEQTKTKQKTMENIWSKIVGLSVANFAFISMISDKTQELLMKGAKKQFDEENLQNSSKEDCKCDFCLNVNGNDDVYDCTICKGAFCSNCSLSL